MNESLLNAAASTDASGSPPALDVSVIEGLRALADGDDSMVTEIFTAFLTDGEDRLRKMRLAVAENDDTSVRRAAHSLKGMSGSIGAGHLSGLSHDLERSAPGTITVARIDVLEQEFQRVSAALKTL